MAWLDPRGAVRLAAALADLVLPRTCPGCGAAGSWCDGCATALHAPARAVRVDLEVPVVAVATYTGSVRAALLAYKEHGRGDLVGPLAAALARAALEVAGAAPGGLRLIPVPSRPAAVRTRGRDATRVLAAAGAEAVHRHGRPAVVAPVLRLVRPTRDQAGLTADERGANLAGAMTAGRLHGRAVVVDDVVTTGATLREAVRALRHSQVEVSGCAVVAATVLRRPTG